MEMTFWITDKHIVLCFPQPDYMGLGVRGGSVMALHTFKSHSLPTDFFFFLTASPCDFELFWFGVLIPKKQMLLPGRAPLLPWFGRWDCHLVVLGSLCYWTHRQRQELLCWLGWLTLITKGKLGYCRSAGSEKTVPEMQGARLYFHIQ